MNREKIAKELVAIARQLTAAIREGYTYELNLKKALAADWATPQWKSLVKKLHRRSDGLVSVAKVDRNRGVAEVYEAHLPNAFIGTVQVPLDALVGPPIRS